MRDLKYLSLMAFVMGACSGEAEAPQEPPVRPIKLVTVEQSTNRFPVSYPAGIEAAQSSVSVDLSGEQVAASQRASNL